MQLKIGYADGRPDTVDLEDDTVSSIIETLQLSDCGDEYKVTSLEILHD